MHVIWRWIKIVLSVMMFAAIVAVLLIVGTVKASRGQFLSIQTSSMAPAISRGDLVVVYPVNVNYLHRGDVISFAESYNPHVMLTRRVVNTPAMLGSDNFQTKGDGNKTADNPINPSAIIGKVTYAIPKIGYVASIVHSLPGLLLVIYLPTILLTIVEIRRIITYNRDQETADRPKKVGKPNRERHQAMVRALIVLTAVTMPLILGALAYAALQSQSALSGNVISASVPQLPVCYEAGTLTQDTTWTPDCVQIIEGVTIPNSITLTIEPGTIIKYGETTGDTITVNIGGSLNATGTSTNPAIFTSLEDSSAGGQSEGSDTIGQPYGYDTAITNAGGSVEVHYADFRYGVYSINDSSGDICTDILTDSTVDGELNVSNHTADNLTVERNTFNVDATYTESAIDGDNIDLTTLLTTGPNRNIFNGGSQVSIAASDSQVPTGEVWALDPANGLKTVDMENSVVNGTLNIQSGVTFFVECSSPGGGVVVNSGGAMDVDSGAIIKTGGELEEGGVGDMDLVTGGCTTGNTVSVNSGGTFSATGTPSNPVIFTTYSDSSAGGENNGYGGPAGYYQVAILNNGGSVRAQYTDFRYGNYAVADNNNDSNIDLLTNNIFDGEVFLYNHVGNNLSLEHNAFNIPATDQQPAVTAENIDLTALQTTGPNANTFSDSYPVTITVSSSVVPSGATWTLDPASGLQTLDIGQSTVDGTLNVETGDVISSADCDYDGLMIASGGTINIANGSVIKAGEGSEDAYSAQCNAIYVHAGGTLSATGTAISPVIFTSWRDTTAGGDTSGEGTSAGQPGPGDYGAAIFNSGGSVTVHYANFRYGNLSIEDQDTSNSTTSGGTDIVTDSMIGGELDLCNHTTSSLTVERNTIDLNPSYIEPAISADQIDLSSIPLTGSNENTFSGSGIESTVQSTNSYISATDPPIELDENNGLSAIVLSGLTISGILEIEPGTVIKLNSQGNQGIDVDSTGMLSINGSTSSPVIFTSYDDDSAGGASNGSTSASQPASGSGGTFIRYDSPDSSDIVFDAIFRYATTAISIGPTGDLGVSSSEFAYNAAAINADSTTTNDPILGSQDCVPPYANSVNVSNSWFGSVSGTGQPGPSIDLLSVGGALLSEVGNTIPDYLGQLYGGASSMFNLTAAFGTDNTIPWSEFTCTVSVDPPVVITFPVTPVSISSPATNPLWQIWAEEP
jgi:signal peptidase I